MWVLKKKKSAHLCSWLGCWVWIRTGDMAELLEWERDTDTPEFEVSQNQVDSKGTFGPWRPHGVSAEPLGRIEPPSVPWEDANSVALGTWPPLSSSSEAAGWGSPRRWGAEPTQREGGRVSLAGQGPSAQARWVHQIPGALPALSRWPAASAQPCLRRPRVLSAMGGAWVWGWLLGRLRAQLAGETSGTFG